MFNFLCPPPPSVAEGCLLVTSEVKHKITCYNRVKNYGFAVTDLNCLFLPSDFLTDVMVNGLVDVICS